MGFGLAGMGLCVRLCGSVLESGRGGGGAYAWVMAAGAKKLGSEATTEGVRVEVWPAFMAEQSQPDERQWMFSYRVRITNEGSEAATLESRYWLIVDAHGERHEVRGPGVVGQQPRVEAGEAFEYSSFCPLRTAWGTMEGSFQMRRDDGRAFEAVVARFYLAAK